MLNKIQEAIKKLDELSKTKKIRIISHFDTDGITSAAIISRAFQRWNKPFSLQIVKNLEVEFIQALPENEILLFLDLGSGSMHELAKKNTEILILDHHELPSKEIPKNITLINPLIFNENPISGAGVCYLFAKSISNENKDLSALAVIGLVGDLLEKDLSKFSSVIINDSETILKKGLLLYPSTRPLDKALEYSSNPYIPEVTGSFKGVMDLLREANIQQNKDGKFKSLHELNENEMSRLITAVMLRLSPHHPQDILGNIFLVKFFNKLEDARELSALINACSRMDYPHLALGFCLGNKKFKEEAEKIYIDYKQHLISALRYVAGSEKIAGKDYAIINAKDNIKDTIIGTIASIISHSPQYPEGTIIIALAYNENKIKVSARLAGKKGKNVREILTKVMIPFGGEVGGHPNAAGCLISREHESLFLEELQKTLEIDLVKV